MRRLVADADKPYRELPARRVDRLGLGYSAPVGVQSSIDIFDEAAFGLTGPSLDLVSIYQSRIDADSAEYPKAQPIKHAGPVVLDKYVSVGYEAPLTQTPSGMLESHDHSTFLRLMLTK